MAGWAGSYSRNDLELDFFEVLTNATDPHKAIVPRPEGQMRLALNRHRKNW
jgi:hypothetical protein